MTYYNNDPAEYNQDYFEQLDRENEEAQANVALEEARREYKMLRKDWKALRAQFSPADANNASFDEKCAVLLDGTPAGAKPQAWIDAAKLLVEIAQMRVEEAWSLYSDYAQEE